MFTEKQIQLMKRIGISADFNNPTDKEWIEIENKVGDWLTLQCLDENYYPNEEGIMCENILDLIP